MSDKTKKEDYKIQVISFNSNLTGRSYEIFVFTNLNSTQLRGVIAEKIRSVIKTGHNHIELFNQNIRVDDIVDNEVLNEIRTCKSLEAFKDRVMAQTNDCFGITVMPIERFLESKLIDFDSYMRPIGELQKVVNAHVGRNPIIRNAINTEGFPNWQDVMNMIENLETEYNIN